ncbi:hypothetical protein [Lysinibacillus antri]|uniref:Uncharacterized protein n=1 Tax=Lysinibacillus antri TaxID=2498145 RepID=A0A3S0PSK5_9BACI|nr:hypothetical protein [Lysinibacillus antri]RUL57027.1 hypothetical protein EK386_01000 [Lysinibacillus antri]
MGNNGKVWIVIGLVIMVIGIGLSVLFSVISDKKIDQLVERCENDGGKAIVEKSGFIITTSFKFECQK